MGGLHLVVGNVPHVGALEGLASVLLSHGWAELSSELTFKELALATEYLEGSFGGFESETVTSYSDGYEVVTLKPSTLQFFYDLYGFGSSIEPVDILVSYISETERQEYSRYAGADPADVQAFFQAIHNKPAFIFQGTFAPLQKKDGSVQDVSWLRRQRTLNGICIDVDGAEFVDGKHPVEGETLESLLGMLPTELTPSYICLTGNGVHLWYVFDSPVQTFSRNTVRQRKLRALSTGLYRVYGALLDSYDAEPDEYCASLNHCFRAPGSLTKSGDVVRCFCPEASLFRHSTVSAVELSRTVASILGTEFSPDNVLSEGDAAYKTRIEIERDHQAWIEQRLNTPATESQLEFIRSLEEEGLVKPSEMEGIGDISLLDAQNLIKKALNRREEGGKRVGNLNDYSAWTQRPHWLIAGETGGVYNTIFTNITRVKPGNRYNSLHMLAGVAYMMVKPEKTLASLTEDFMGLLKTPWAKAGRPLTERDVKNALLGYNPDNRQTINSVIRTLGFNPFGEPAKRNGRTREQHLAMIAEKRTSEAVGEMVRALKEQPGARKIDVIRATGLSKATVYKYWEKATSRALQ